MWNEVVWISEKKQSFPYKMQYSYRWCNSDKKAVKSFSPLKRRGGIYRFSKDEREFRKTQTAHIYLQLGTYAFFCLWGLWVCYLSPIHLKILWSSSLRSLISGDRSELLLDFNFFFFSHVFKRLFTEILPRSSHQSAFCALVLILVKHHSYSSHSETHRNTVPAYKNC